MNKPTQSVHSYYWIGLRDTVPFLLIIIPFGLLWGVVGSEAGFDLTAVIAMSLIVVAGAAQFTATSLMVEQSPLFITVLAALAVNLRMVMYSAALAPHLGGQRLGMRLLTSYFMVDQNFALSIKKFEDAPEMKGAEKAQYYLGSATLLVIGWVIASVCGAVFGATIPDYFALDFAIPICFIALSAPLMRSLPHFVAAVVSVIGALMFVNMPYSSGLLLASVIAMIAGVQTEMFLKRRGGKS
ncbi:branched-chain amino acid transporter AzlC [Amylibacter marinus]|uniref:Branched-chain amino acid transporter AzlC n=1 Tax=Amylibacter marinus TaxID=1475483 RepID=A0ABQ5VWQ7_9RHOB|nr:AzlC family ABC transporter permease [Amylibacter marinus]GLQ35866.1 branched-chain amino acid transporter AzlC [Amylibacter marinus]